MNRRASLEWNLETLGKLIFSVLVLIFIVYMTWKLVGIFIGGNKDYVAERNLDFLHERIELMRDNGENSSSVIISLPENYIIIAYSPEKTSYEIDYSKKMDSISGTDFLGPAGAGIRAWTIFKQLSGDYKVTLRKDTGIMNGCDKSCLCVYHIDVGRFQDQHEASYDPLTCKSHDLSHAVAFLPGGSPYNAHIALGESSMTITMPASE